jgi:hypothetical protein
LPISSDEKSAGTKERLPTYQSVGKTSTGGLPRLIGGYIYVPGKLRSHSFAVWRVGLILGVHCVWWLTTGCGCPECCTFRAGDDPPAWR